jgi:hypothetical protein
MFGMDAEQTRKSGHILRILAEEWRDLVAGREGFLVDGKKAGLLRQAVVWGEMDIMVLLFLPLLSLLPLFVLLRAS